MRFIPSKNNFFEDVFDSVLNTPSFGGGSIMKTDIYEKDGKYNLIIEAPGYKREDINISLYQGNLTISLSKNETTEEKDGKGNVIRQERYSGNCSRTFYVGEGIRESDIVASLEEGELKISLPTAKQKEIEERKTISIL
ncbi:MAG: Hsp20/alpha crystallin family protein [Erysipelotrichaceae bacterium]|nr:Hsp20/alpha crystallin family protein [Erysipelotrichaceae bacterium]